MLNRNRQTDFSKVAYLKSARSKFNRLSETILTANKGELIPFFNDIDILPADTHSYTTSIVARTVKPLVKPLVNGNMKLDYFYFYVPYSQIWNIDHLKAFMGEAVDSAWINTAEYTIPQLKFSHTMFGTNSTVDSNGNITLKTSGVNITPKDFCTKYSNSVERYLFLPTLPTSIGATTVASIGFKDSNNLYCAFAEDISVSAFTLRAYHSIYNSFFRREDLIAPVTLDKSDTTKNYTSINDLTPCYKVSKYKDYYVSNLPQPQKSIAGDVFLPLGTRAPVFTGEDNTNLTTGYALHWYNSSTGNTVTSSQKLLGLYSSNPGTVTSATLQYSTTATELANSNVAPLNLYTDLTQATASTVNALRMAVASQRIYEKFARYGSRVEETIRGQFGVVAKELELQIPEYLGGYSIPINIQECTDLSADLGKVGAKSVTVHMKHDVTKSFTQWGVVLGLFAIRQNHVYTNGIERGYFRKRIFDFYWPTFVNLGEQPTYNREVFAWNRMNETFGFHEAWAEYRYKPSRIAGQIMDFADFQTYVMADNYSDCPYLGQDWIEEDNAQLRYAMGLTDESYINDFIIDIAVLDTAVRPMSVNSIPGLMDHM